MNHITQATLLRAPAGGSPSIAILKTFLAVPNFWNYVFGKPFGSRGQLRCGVSVRTKRTWKMFRKKR
jgi:hypothetical protein